MPWAAPFKLVLHGLHCTELYKKCTTLYIIGWVHFGTVNVKKQNQSKERNNTGTRKKIITKERKIKGIKLEKRKMSKIKKHKINND